MESFDVCCKKMYYKTRFCIARKPPSLRTFSPPSRLLTRLGCENIGQKTCLPSNSRKSSLGCFLSPFSSLAVPKVVVMWYLGSQSPFSNRHRKVQGSKGYQTLRITQSGIPSQSLWNHRMNPIEKPFDKMINDRIRFDTFQEIKKSNSNPEWQN